MRSGFDLICLHVARSVCALAMVIVFFCGSNPAIADVLSQYQSYYEDGFGEGFSTGYDSGFATGYGRGEVQGSSDGTEQGYQAGWEEAYEPAYQLNYQPFWETGSAEGYDTGFDRGYQRGYEREEDSYVNWVVSSLSSNIWAVLNGPGSYELVDFFGIDWNTGYDRTSQINISGVLLSSGSGVLEDFDWAEHSYQEGRKDGREEGEKNGDQAGYDEAYPISFGLAYQPAFGNGEVEGNTQGLLDGASEGFDEGWEEGLAIGDTEGFDAGVDSFRSSVRYSEPVSIVINTQAYIIAFTPLFVVPTLSISPQTAAIPEPSSLFLAGISLIPFAISRRQCKRRR